MLTRRYRHEIDSVPQHVDDRQVPPKKSHQSILCQFFHLPRVGTLCLHPKAEVSGACPQRCLTVGTLCPNPGVSGACRQESRALATLLLLHFLKLS
eukprot:4463295-Pyramimonas_sp.AAC.1